MSLEDITRPFTQGRPSNPEREGRQPDQAWGEVRDEPRVAASACLTPDRGAWGAAQTQRRTPGSGSYLSHRHQRGEQSGCSTGSKTSSLALDVSPASRFISEPLFPDL